MNVIRGQRDLPVDEVLDTLCFMAVFIFGRPAEGFPKRYARRERFA